MTWRSFILALLLLAAFPARAEIDDLLGPMMPDSVAAPDPAPPETLAVPAPAGESASVASAALQTPSLAGYGTLTGKRGGLSSTLWQGSQAGTIIPLLEEAGAALTRGTLAEGALRDIARRVALTHAVEPDGNSVPGTDFFAGRVMLAAAAGDPEGAVELSKTNPAFISEENAQRFSAILLMQAKVIEACADPKLQSPSTPFWQKLSVVCALGMEGGRPRAQLALDLMREAGENDTLFLDLAEQAASGKKKIKIKEVPASMHVLHAALLAVTGLPPLPGMLGPLSQTPYPLLLHVKGPDVWRAGIALRLARTRWVTAGTVQNLFGGFTLNPKTLAALRLNIKLLASPKAIPVALQVPYALAAAAALENARAKAALLALLVSLLAPEDLAGALGEVVMDSMPQPTSEFTAEAPTITRLALLQASPHAKNWMALTASPPSLAPLAVLRGFIPESARAEALALYAKEQSIPLEQRANALGVLEALGISAGDKATATLTALGATLAEAAEDGALKNALNQKAEGEALLRVLVLSPPEVVSVLLLRIKTLRALGFEKEAIELALPAL